MKRPSLASFLLLPLLAVLLFGNCGGGVHRFLGQMSYDRSERLRSIVLRQRAERADARRRFSGRLRADAYKRIEQTVQARTDSMLSMGFEVRKFRNRRHKVERQLLRLPSPPHP